MEENTVTELRPGPGLPVTVGGIEFHFLFTWAVVDALQSRYQLSLWDVVQRLADPMTAYETGGRIITELIADDIYRNGEGLIKPPTYEQVMHVIDMKQTDYMQERLLKAYGISMPEKDEDDDDEEDPDEERDQINLARLLVIGKTKLGMTEDEFWTVTPRKYFHLFDEYIALQGGQKTQENSIDALP